MGQAADSMMALSLSLNQWVGALCLAVAGPTMAQLEVNLARRDPFSLFHHSALI